ncbi:MAG TPA: hypothetical protein VNN72_19485, partial [Polyangiaceae bacterium]|nr:hypothetical protein [Polyangiaceae bacterium]
RPCIQGLSCHWVERPENGTVPDLGTCQAPLPLGATCDGYTPPCEEGARCIDQTCQRFTISRKVGDPCDATTFCSADARLVCNGTRADTSPLSPVIGVCELVGDGSEGAPCWAIDIHALVDCDPGLTCLDADPTDPGVQGMMRSEICGKPRAAGEPCDGNDDCASQHCLADKTCGDTYCCGAYSCQSN